MFLKSIIFSNYRVYTNYILVGFNYCELDFIDFKKLLKTSQKINKQINNKQ